jgi:hypothetical protein
MSGEAAAESRCAVCGGPGRYVREPKTRDARIWCAEHAPAALSPWVMLVRAVLVLAILGLALYPLLRRLTG